MRSAMAIVLALLGGCYSPSVQTGLPCSALGECPSGQVCDRGTCVETPRPDDGGGTDTAVPDDALDAPLIDARPMIDAPPGQPAWIETTALPSARSLACAAELDGRIYMTGGSFNGASKTDVLISAIQPTGVLGAWATGPELPVAVRWHACAIDRTNRSLYVIGGDGGTTARADVYRATIDPGTGALGAWVAQPSLPAGRRGHGAVWVSDQLYVIAGEQSDGFNIKDTVFRATTGPSGIAGVSSWATTTGLLNADYMFGTVTAGGRIYLTGGFNGGLAARLSSLGAGGVPSSFTQTTAMPGSRERHISITDGAYVYVTGGEVGFNGANLKSTFRAQVDPTTGALGAWSALPDLPLALTYSTGVYAGGRIYVLGGSDGTGQTPRVFMLQNL